MRRPPGTLVLAVTQIVTCVSLLLAGGTAAADDVLKTFTESFSSELYCDTLNTTAWWDTVAGELKLYPFELTLVDTVNLMSPYGVAVAGDYAYVGDGSPGLLVFDIQDPTSPLLAGSYNTSGFAHGVVVAGNYAYVADDNHGLQVIDISNPASPTLEGSCSTGGTAVGVAVSDSYAYVANTASGLKVVDISLSAYPTVVATYDTPGSATSVVIWGNCAYVADGSSGLQIIDITDPTSPTLHGSYDTPGTAFGVAVSGDYAYVGDGFTGLLVIDISDPSSPVLEGSYNTSGYAEGIALCGDYVYVTDGGYDGNFHVIDITDPTSPTLISTFDVPETAAFCTVAGCYAYVSELTYGGLYVIDISDPLDPFGAGNYNTSGTASHCAVSGDYAFVADYAAGLQALDISNPTAPSLMGSYNTAGLAMSLAVDGDYAFVADYDTGLLVIDVSDPTTPTLSGSYDTPGQAYSVAVAGDHALVADGFSGVQLIDISDGESPSLTDSYDTPGEARGVAVDGDLVFVADGALGGFLVLDMLPPDEPALLGSCQTPGDAVAVAVHGDYVLVADGASGIQVVDVSDPTNPAIVGNYDTPGSASGVAVEGDCAFVADGDGGVLVLDISDPETPVLAGSLDTPGSGYGLTLAGDYVFLADGGEGLQVIQVFYRLFQSENNRGQSRVFASSADEISAVRFTSTQVDSVYWHASADGGTNWTHVPADTFWHQIDVPGHDLAWRAELFSRQHHVNPTCTSVNVEWKYSVAIIDTVVDVPEDEGGWARVRFQSSGLDVAAQGSSVVKHYYVHRRIDDIGFTEELLRKGVRVEEPVSIALDGGICATASHEAQPAPVLFVGTQTYLLGGRYYSVSHLPVAGALPPGTWEVITGLPALQEYAYYSLTPTRADSMSTFEYTVYCVTAHTDESTLYYVSPPDSGYSRDNMAPTPPADLKGDYAYPPAQLFICWDRNRERDLSHYAVYKGDNPDFVPSPTNRIGVPWDTNFVDTDFDPNADNYYKVSAWDIHENEGTFSLLSPEDISEVESPPAPPTTTRLEQNFPNPFNPTTVIKYSVARQGWVALRIYDMAGRLVRTLVSEARPAGWYEAVWDGRDDAGRGVPSGVYAYELQAPLHREARKMVVLR